MTVPIPIPIPSSSSWQASETLLGVNNVNRRYMLYVCMYIYI